MSGKESHGTGCKVPCIPESDSVSTYSMAESIKKHKRHDKSKKHKKHKKKSKKSKKTFRRSRSTSSDDDDCVVLKLNKNKLEESVTGIPVTLDVVMETIVSRANAKSKDFMANKCYENENIQKENMLSTSVNDVNHTRPNNGKIIIKDLKDSILYHELTNRIHEDDLETEKYEDDREYSCSPHEIDKKQDTHKSKRKKRSKSRNRSSTPKRHKKHNRSHSRSRDRYSRYDDFRRGSSSRERNRHKDKYNRSITPVKEIRRSRSNDTKKPKRLDRSRSRDMSTYRRYRSPSCEKIDKKKLFKIARKNALSLVQQGVLPVGSVQKEFVGNVPTKTVDELTDFCRKLSKKEKEHYDSSISTSDEEFKQPFHHPFLVKDRPNIVLNIRNATQLPTKSFQEKTIGQDVLRQQFPVSSGQIHSLAVSEWVPVDPENAVQCNNKPPQLEEENRFPERSLVQQTTNIFHMEPGIQPNLNNVAVIPLEYQFPPPPIEPPATMNPYAINNYSLLSFETGQFTGHTGAKVLTPAELSAGYQPWVKKDQLKNTAPVNSGIGIHLLQKMGWKPGEGLGKNQSGSLEPLLLDVKIDKRGLVTEEELKTPRIRRFQKKVIPTLNSLEGKHPVSLLNEFCAKRKWDVPKFATIEESGPSHRKSFVMTVIVNGKLYSSPKSQTKKSAKMEAAKTCLREIGFIKLD